MNIAIDIDGTCANLIEAMVPWLNNKYKDDAEWKVIHEADIHAWNPELSGHLFIDEVIEAQQDYDFMVNIKPYPHAVEAITKLFEHEAYHIIFATNRRFDNGDCGESTHAWIRRTFKIEPFEDVDVLFLKDHNGKQNLKADTLIDDHPSNLMKFYWEKPLERYGFLIEQPWNSDFRNKLFEGFAFFRKIFDPYCKMWFQHTYSFPGWSKIGGFLNLW